MVQRLYLGHVQHGVVPCSHVHRGHHVVLRGIDGVPEHVRHPSQLPRHVRTVALRVIQCPPLPSSFPPPPPPLLSVYRLFTYGAFHSSTFHLVINVLFLASVGRTVEGKLGTWYLLNVVLVFSIMCAFIQMLLEYVISFVYPPVLDNCLPGFSGILFGILVLALGVTKGKNHNVFGLFTIPKMLYPWLLLAVSYAMSYWEFSVTANLAGLIIGYACILSNTLIMHPVLAQVWAYCCW